MSDQAHLLGIVAIGRNEGERLKACLSSLPISTNRVVYVDSGSSDGSVELAHRLAVDVVELDMSIPFSAGRARNEGVLRLLLLEPELRYIQFLDGDCILDQDWLKKGITFLESNLDFAIACGRRRERYPDASIYNRVIDMEWDTPIGETPSCGGDFMVRADVFRKLGGFDPSVVAGEEPEMCSRLRQLGWRIMRLDAEMTVHDSAMTRLSQWWKRSLRTGYGGLDVYQRCANDEPRPFKKIIDSSRYWVVGWPTLMIVSSLLGYALGGGSGFFLGLAIAVSVLPAQILRMALKRFRSGLPLFDAVAYSLLIMIAKVPEFLGQLRFFRERFNGIEASIIEHRG
jgi:glycosyltransferase involved in cell wall biosynthesis